MTEADKTPVTVLAVDDEPQVLELITTALSEQGIEVLTSTDPEEALELVRRRRPAIVLSDLMMPKMSGMELLERILNVAPDTEVVLMTAYYSTESAVEAIKKGACDYLNKPVAVEVLRQRIGKLVADARQRQQASQLDGALLEASQFEGLVGRSPLMMEVFTRIRRVAPHYRTVLVSGATGTGKELVARALHRHSPVASGQFGVCNCSAIVETLFESELFGHVRGAFTGAGADKIGLFEYANGGTVFLDEIGDMPPATQAKLLRVLQNQEIQRVGSPVVRKVNVRVVAATHRDLRAMAAGKTFREDLYYRLSMIEIKLPRLADRREDIPLLLKHLLGRFSEQYGRPFRGLTPRAQAILACHSWPGNVRELENVIGSACMLTGREVIDVSDLEERLRRPSSGDAWADEELLSLEDLQRRHVRRVLERVEGNKVRAAEILGISRATLYRLLSDQPTDTESGSSGKRVVQ
jgi:DNA-binding NtrC family response regulator